MRSEWNVCLALALVLPHLVAFISIRNELLLFAYLYKWLLLVWALTVCIVLINTNGLLLLLLKILDK